MQEKIGYLPSEIHLCDELKVRELLDFHEKFYDGNFKQRRKELVNLFQLDELKVEALSLGNQKKLGIILALLHNPKILILDEPTSGLDPIMQNVFYDLLKEEKKKGTTILYSTHVLSEVAKICDRVGIIKNGNLIQIENIENMKEKKKEIVTISSPDILKIKSELKIKVIFQDDSIIKFLNPFDSNILLKKLTSYSIDKILIEEMNL